MNSQILEFKKEKEILRQNILNQENRNKNLNDISVKKDEQIKTLSANYEELLNKYTNLTDEIVKIKDDNEKYKNNCKILKEQNNKLMDEINNIISFNQKFKDILKRKEKAKILIEENKTIFQDSLKNMEINIDNEIEQNTF